LCRARKASRFVLPCAGDAALEQASRRKSNGETVMKTFVSLIVALGVAAGATAPAFAAEPKTKADCVKAHMKWDDAAKKCGK
jgi:hypothetical protein